MIDTQVSKVIQTTSCSSVVIGTSAKSGQGFNRQPEGV